MDVNLLKGVFLLRRLTGAQSPKRALLWLIGLSILPMAAFAFWLGFACANLLPEIDPNRAGSAAAAFILLLGLISGLFDGSCSLPVDALGTFQARPGVLFLGELLLGLLTPAKLYLMALASAWSLGLAILHPRLVPWLGIAMGFLLLWTFSLERLVGALSQLLGRNLRWLLLFFLMVFGLRLISLTSTEGASIRGTSYLCSLAFLAPILPTTWLAAGWQGALAGRWNLLQLLAGPILWTLFLLGMAYLFLRPRLIGEKTAPIPISRRSWTFQKPWVGVAKLQFNTIWNTKIGRLLLFMPWVGLNGLVAPRAFAKVPGPTWIIAWFGYVQMIASGPIFNLFGLDRGAVRGYWTLPIEDRDLLKGKVLGHAAFALFLSFLFLACVPLFAVLSPLEYLAAGEFSLALFLTHALEGMRHSSTHPAPLDPSGFKPSDGGDVDFGKVGRALYPWLLLVVIWGLSGNLGPIGRPCIMALVCIFSWIRLERGFPEACGRLSANRDILTLILERDPFISHRPLD